MKTADQPENKPEGNITKATIYRGSYMCDHVLLNLVKELRKRIKKMRCLPSNLSLFPAINKYIQLDKSTNVRFYLSYEKRRILIFSVEML